MKSIPEKIRKIILGSLPFVALLIFWQLASNFRLFPDWLLPSPIDAGRTFIRLLLNGTLGSLVLISISHSLPAFFLALVLGLIVGTAIGISSNIKNILMPFLSSIYLIPSLAWLPLIILLLGFTRGTILVVIFISSFMKIVYNVIGGVKAVNKNWILAAKNLGFSRMEIIFKVILPGALPQILTGIRLGFGSAWRSLIGAEMLVVTLGGLGKFIWMSQWYFKFDQVIIGIVVIAIIGLAVETLIFKKIEKATLGKWGLNREDA